MLNGNVINHTKETNNPYFPLHTDIHFSVELGSIPPHIKNALTSASQVWRNGTKFKHDTRIFLDDNTDSPVIKLSQSVIKIEKDVYAIHRATRSKGGKGKIKEIESLSTGLFYLMKIQKIPSHIDGDDYESLHDVQEEVAHSLDAGLCIGQTRRVVPSQTSILSYTIKHYMVMPNLGTDLKTLLSTANQLGSIIPEEVRFKIAIEAVWELANTHSGQAFISGEGRTHRDVKPSNIVLSKAGVRLIDLGLTQKDPEKPVSTNVGTPHYIEFVNLTIKRSGRFFDLDAMRRVLYAPLCYLQDSAPNPIKQVSILTRELANIYNLTPYLERAFDTSFFVPSSNDNDNDNTITIRGKYVDEHALAIQSATLLAALLIGAQIQLNQKQLMDIRSKSELATTVVGVYFSNQHHWLQYGKTLLDSLWSLSEEELHCRAELVELGLSHELNEALSDRSLIELLRSSIPRQMKRAIVCLFKRHLWNNDALTALKTQPNLSLLCLKAHFYNDESQLVELLKNNTPPADIPWLQNNIEEALEGFPLTQQDIQLMHQHHDTLSFLYQPFNSNDYKVEARQKIDNGARLYYYLTNEPYQRAVSAIYDLYIHDKKNEALCLLTELLTFSNIQMLNAGIQIVNANIQMANANIQMANANIRLIKTKILYHRIGIDPAKADNTHHLNQLLLINLNEHPLTPIPSNVNNAMQACINIFDVLEKINTYTPIDWLYTEMERRLDISDSRINANVFRNILVEITQLLYNFSCDPQIRSMLNKISLNQPNEASRPWSFFCISTPKASLYLDNLLTAINQLVQHLNLDSPQTNQSPWCCTIGVSGRIQPTTS